MSLLSTCEIVPGLGDAVSAWTTTRASGSFGLGGAAPVGEAVGRWEALAGELTLGGIPRLASAHQVHGAEVLTHGDGWRGWLRALGADGHVTTTPGTALAVTIADCTPILVAHPAGAIAALHAGWRGTAAGILSVGLDRLAAMGYPADECAMHLGPAICGACYEVGPEVLSALTGRPAQAKGHVDVRLLLAEQAAAQGVRAISVSQWCTRCHRERFFSHRGGDFGRQLGIIALQSS